MRAFRTHLVRVRLYLIRYPGNFCESRKPSALSILASIPMVFIDDISVYFWTKREHGNHL